jgi:16S rRNA pseudouridine516 synthase
MRIDKYLSKALGITRKDAKKAVSSGQVLIDGLRPQSTGQMVSDHQAVDFNQQRVLYSEHYYLMLNKPQGYICSTQDEDYPSAIALLTHNKIPVRQFESLHFAGRLDVDTTGMVLVSNDGQWTHRITSPRYKKNKRYLVSLAEPIKNDALILLEKGLLLKGDDRPTLPATVEQISDSVIRLTIQEGRYHQIKRMLGAVNNRVTQLHREAIGELELDSLLGRGEYRELTSEEIVLF